MRKNLFNRRMLGNLLVRWCEGLRIISSNIEKRSNSISINIILNS
ncbi:hypothetical protein [Texas Phoenix palm phytoplasma]|nr:hypothetical protein [Texas Phoenix palm phytoplasma]